jgi:hypothetical protein
MQAAVSRTRHTMVHIPVEEKAPDGKMKIRCTSPRCAAWDPWPCETRHEAEFWYERHISQPVIYHL